MAENNVLVLGGDKRLDFVYETLQRKKRNCYRVNLDRDNLPDVINGSVYVVLPVPSCDSKGNIFSANKDFSLSCEHFTELLSIKNIVFGCNINKELRYHLERKNIIYYDLNNNEEFLMYNAFLTAQSALRLLLENTQELLTDKNVLITGFGRVSKALALTLKGIMPDITVCARKKEQLSEAYCLGFKTVTYENLSSELKNKDFIFNTVPEKVFHKEQISSILDDAKYFELASSPFGADKKDFDELNKTYIFAGGLPGKFTPYSAGMKIAEIIEKMI